MREVYESTGTLVAWMDDQAIFDREQQRWAAFLSGDLVYAGGGRVLGYFADCFFWDIRGNAIAFVVGARPGRGIVLPHLQVGVLDTPVFPHKPIRPVAPEAPPRADRKMGWSFTWNEFIEGRIRTSRF